VKRLAWLAMTVAACGADFDPGSRVSDFRLIAVGADEPFAAPGDRVTVSTLWHDPEGRPTQWAWTTCTNPDDSTVTACLRSLAAQARSGAPPVVTAGADMDRFTWTVPADALDALPPDTRQAALAGILTVACPGTLRLDLATDAGAGLPIHCLDAASGADLPYERFAVSVRRIFLRAHDRNADPAIGQVTWDGQPWGEADVPETTACANDTNDIDACDGGERHGVAAIPTADSAESGVDEFGAPFTEAVAVQFYASEGTFEFDARTAATARLGSDWVARASARGAEVIMWFVVRDDRGGVSWTSRRVHVRP